MKKIRYIPYGYTMRNGRTVISNEEAEVIREIFKAYLDGTSLKAIAEELTGRQIPYTQKTTTWDVSPGSSTMPSMSGQMNMTPS